MALKLDSGFIPLWQRPARLASRWHRGLRPFLETDLFVLNALKVPNTVLSGVILAVVGVPSFFHAIAQFGQGTGWSLFSPVIFDVFTESMPFMAAALLIGLLAPTAGAALVAAFIPLDLIAASLQQAELTPFWSAVAGRGVSYWLLWLLVVEIPMLVRTALDAVDRPRQSVRLVALAVGVAGGAVLAWVWSQAVTMLIRPVFTWSDMMGPSYSAVAPVQEAAEVLAVIGGLGAAAAGFIHLRLAPGRGLPLFAEEPPSPRRRAGMVPLTVLLTLTLFGGMITTVFDVVLLVIAVVAARPIALVLRRRLGFWDRLSEIPWVLRFGVAFALAYLVAALIVVPLYQSTIGSEFFPLVLAQVFILIVYEFFVGEDTPTPPAAKPASGIVTGLLAVAFLVMIWAVPNVARADNCSGRSDCWPVPWPAAAGAAGAGGAAMMNRNKNMPRDKDPIAKARRATDLLSKTPGTKQLPIQKQLIGRMLGWMFDSSNEIAKQLGDDPPRSDFTEISEAAPRAHPELPLRELVGDEISEGLAQVWNTHLESTAHGEAAVIAFDRYGGAKKAGDREWMARQAAAVVRHKKAMAPALRSTSDALERVWRLADTFNPTGNVPSDLLDRVTDSEAEFARSVGFDEVAIETRQNALSEGRGLPDDEDIARITRSYRRMADAFERLPGPLTVS